MLRGEFTANVLRTQEALRSFLRVLCCGDGPMADDIAQEAYMKAYLAVDSITDENKFASWVRRIAINIFLNEKRSERPRADIEEAALCSSDFSADSAFENEELKRAIASLPPKERAATLLYYMEGISTAEVARTIGSSILGVRKLLSRARKRLQKQLER